MEEIFYETQGGIFVCLIYVTDASFVYNCCNFDALY